jgi:hypothetical protein
MQSQQGTQTHTDWLSVFICPGRALRALTVPLRGGVAVPGVEQVFTAERSLSSRIPQEPGD